MVGALLDGVEGKPRVLDVNTFLVEGVHLHRAVQEDLLSDQRLFHNCPNDFFSFTLLPIVWFRATCIDLFPELLIRGVKDTFTFHHSCKLFVNGNNRRLGPKKPSVRQDVDEDWKWRLLVDLNEDLRQFLDVRIVRDKDFGLSSDQGDERDPHVNCDVLDGLCVLAQEVQSIIGSL